MRIPDSKVWKREASVCRHEMEDEENKIRRNFSESRQLLLRVTPRLRSFLHPFARHHLADEENALNGRFAIVDDGEPLFLLAALVGGAESNMDFALAAGRNGVFGPVGAGAGAGRLHRLDEQVGLADVAEDEIVEDRVSFGHGAVVEFGFGEFNDRGALARIGEIELGAEAKRGQKSKEKEGKLLHQGEVTQKAGQRLGGGYSSKTWPLRVSTILLGLPL